jgi:hypothetical protein
LGGSDCVRKGDNLLLEVWRQHFSKTCELHLVAR